MAITNQSPPATRQQTCKFIGMLHVPVNSIIVYPPEMKKVLQLPEMTAADWEIIREMEHFAEFRCGDDSLVSPSLDLGLEIVSQLEEKAGRFSFIRFLQERLLREAELYFKFGADTLLLENIAAPYFVRDYQPLAVFAVMSRLARRLRECYPDGQFAIQILAFGENLAMDIAVRYGFSFIRGESLLFSGWRPEGCTPNQGNLARLYMLRNQLVDTLPDLSASQKIIPEVYADIQKKHTVFPEELGRLDLWLENLLFLKLEGVVLTGSATGKPVKSEDLQKTSAAVVEVVRKIKELSEQEWYPEIVVGSGVTPENLQECKKFATAAIVGSSLKENGYWECPLDHLRLQKFMEKWGTA